MKTRDHKTTVEVNFTLGHLLVITPSLIFFAKPNKLTSGLGSSITSNWIYLFLGCNGFSCSSAFQTLPLFFENLRWCWSSFLSKKIALHYKSWYVHTHLRYQYSRGGADLSNAATAANLPQKLTELWLLDFTLSLHSHYVVVMPSLVPNNDIKRKPFSCRIQPSSDIGTTDI